MKRVDAISTRFPLLRKAFIAEADLYKFVGGQFFVNHLRYVLEDVKSTISAMSIGARDNWACDRKRQSIGSVWQRTRIRVSYSRALLPRFNQNGFQTWEGSQKFSGHGNRASLTGA